MHFFRRSRILLTSCSLLLTPLAHAAGFQFYELGAPINGSAGVGQAVITNDASASYYNPAAMAGMMSSQFLLGAQPMLTYTNFSPNSSNTLTGDNGSDAGGFAPSADAFFVYRYSPKLKLGASITAPYLGSLSYDNFWVGRYNVEQMLLYTLNFNPALGYQLNDWLALGAGVSVEYANMYQTVALPIAPGLDGQATVKADSTAPGFNLGAYITPSPDTHVGMAFRSQIIHNLRGTASFLNIPELPSATTKLVMPANVIASISQRMSSRFTLLGEMGWSNWSSMTTNIVSIAGFTAVTPQNWRDTYRLGVGGHYHYSHNLLLLAGLSYDSSPTSASKRLPELPADRQIRAGVGMEYWMSMLVHLGLSYEYINLGKASINNASASGVLSGDYSRNYSNIVQASLNITC